MALVFSAAALVLNIFTLVFLFAYWKGKVDIKVDIMWDVYVTGVLSRDRLRRSGSRAPMAFPSEWYAQVKSVCPDVSAGRAGEVGYRVVRCLGVDRINRVAAANGQSFDDGLAQFIDGLVRESGDGAIPGQHHRGDEPWPDSQ